MSIDRPLVTILWLAVVGGSCNLQGPAPGRDEVDQKVTALQERGKAGVEANRPAEAERDLQQAFDRHTESGDHAGASVDARWLMRLYGRTTRYREALRWGDVAHAEAISSENDALIGDAFRELLGILQMIDSSVASDEILEAAERFTSPTNLEGQISLRVHRALKLRAEGLLAEAAQYQEEALALAHQLRDLRGIQVASINLADLALERHRLDDAERHLSEARDAWTRRRSPPSEGLLLNEAILARERGQLDRSSRLLDELARVAPPPDTMWQIDYQRGLNAESAGRRDEAEQSYQRVIDVLEGLRRESAPITGMAEFFETRWIPFERLFALQVDRGDVRAALSTVLRAQGRMFLDALARSAVPSSSVTTPMQTVELVERLEQLRVVASSPLGDPGDLDSVLAALRDRYVITYFVGAGRVRSLVIENGEPRITSTDVSVEDLARMVGDLRGGPDGELLAAEDLGAALLPADALPAAPGRIHVVPSGILLKVPFSALVVAGVRVLDHFEVAYAPSVTSLAVDGRLGDESDGRAVVMADRRLIVRPDDRELTAVVKATGATQYLDREATTATFRAAAHSELLHLITHSGVNPREGYLALDDDQEVTAADILSWRVRPRLVVLPTCASATTRRTEMWGSLAAAFLAAGSQHVVATLMAVPNDDASAFSEAFYRLGGARDPVGGLARAQRELSSTRPVADWSPYIVVGP